MKTILEFIANKKPAKIEKHKYKYQPKSKAELMENIRTELDAGNQDLNCIDTSSITDMEDLFNAERGVNINDYDNIDVSGWDVSNVKTMYAMFGGCINFNCDLSNWDVSSVESMSEMFNNCKKFTGDGLDYWATHSLRHTFGMFFNCKVFNANLSHWYVNNVMNMGYMFYKCVEFDANLSSWKTGNVLNMAYMFYMCKNFNCDLSQWEVQEKCNTTSMLAGGCPLIKTYYAYYGTPKVKNNHLVKK